MSITATATGIGSWPGTSPRQAAEVVVGELHRLPYLPELPARGVGADMIGRGAALLVDIALDTAPRGYRITARPGAVVRRAVSLLDQDLDALEEAWERAGSVATGRPVKVQAPGPVTLAAAVELPGGHRALTDPGAVRDLTASLAEGVARHRAEVARRLGTTVVVQFDEPLLSTALAGRLSGVSTLNPVHPVDEARAVTLLDECAAVVGADVIVHCCAGDVPWDVLCRSAIAAVAVDIADAGDRWYDGLGEFVDSGRTAVLGLLPGTAPARTPRFEEVATAAAALTDRLGFDRRVLGERIGVSASCGFAGATATWAREATAISQRAADVLAEDPAAV